MRWSTGSSPQALNFCGLLSICISLWAGLCGCASTTKSGERLCDNIILREGKIALGKNERTLVCGSSAGMEGWQDVPLPQAQYHLRVFLQNEGYLAPRFEREGSTLHVWAGPRQEIAEFIIEGAGEVLDRSEKREVVGEPLTPAKLDEIEKWINVQLRSQGYACPETEVVAQVWDRKVIAHVKPGPRRRIVEVQREGFDGLDAEILARYQAFNVGDWYDVRELELTTARMQTDGLFQSAYFDTECRGEDVHLNLHALVGKPHVLRFGVGASTEEFPFADVWYIDTRLDDRGSSLEARLHTSPREQSLSGSSKIYRVPWSRRTFFGPRFKLERESERSHEVLSAEAGADLGRQWDRWNLRMEGRFGPTLNHVKTVRGVGPEDVSFLSWRGVGMVMTHPYELYRRDQFYGWSASLDYQGQRKGIGSELNVDRYELDFRHLYNFRGYSPPLFILGSRIEAVGVDTNPVDLEQDRTLLPVDYRVAYGGDQNLRGFGRRVLDNDGLGYLTALYLGFELRLVDELPYKLEPFLLWDGAKLGEKRYTLGESVFTSHGAGLRWPSPFGTLRGSAARGRILNETPATQKYPEEWVYFVNFGQEF
ncbi:MAG: hypothetical protein AB7G93_17960 [Bdellovibrionales bacterium]